MSGQPIFKIRNSNSVLGSSNAFNKDKSTILSQKSETGGGPSQNRPMTALNRPSHTYKPIVLANN